MMGYRAAIQWILDNDDFSSMMVDAKPLCLTVTASLIADIYGHSDEKVISDIQRTYAKSQA
jgi:hypothetical protein